MREVSVKVDGEMLAVADFGDGALVMDVGGKGRCPSPMDAILAALGGCTAVDVYSILTKMREPVEEVRVHVEATRREEHPRVYTDIRLRYVIHGEVSPEKAERAIRLSQEKYCSVGAMLREGGCALTWECEVI